MGVDHKCELYGLFNIKLSVGQNENLLSNIKDVTKFSMSIDLVLGPYENRSEIMFTDSNFKCNPI